jgi:hypothetical protein
MPSTQLNLKEAILNHLDEPVKLEKLYRQDRSSFASIFSEIYPEVKDRPIVQVWHERLNYKAVPAGIPASGAWIFVGIATFLAGLLMKSPDLFRWNPDVFYPKNIAFAVFPFLSAFFIWRNGLQLKKLLAPIFLLVLSAVYINLLPPDMEDDSIMLACIHLPLLLWSLHAFVYTASDGHSFNARVAYLRYNGDLLVMTALMTIAGMIFSMITFGLFRMIGMDIEWFWEGYVAVWGAPAIPILANMLVRENPGLVNRISPLIARIFTPIVCVMLLVFLGSMLVSGKNPYQDREFLMVFNALLIGVMAIIIFSVSEAMKGGFHLFQLLLLLGLSVLTLIVNGIAMSAISFRLFEFGITPNRLAVLGGNLLIMTHLLLVTRQIWLMFRKRRSVDGVERSIAWFLPFYALWTMIVVFGFPLFFGFR